MKVFLSQVIESLDVGPNATRVGLVNYASSVKQEFPLRAHSSKAELLQALLKGNAEMVKWRTKKVSEKLYIRRNEGTYQKTFNSIQS